jgi:hypothetical protein
VDPITLLLTALLAGPVVVTEDDPTLPQGCHPAQVAQRLHAQVNAVHLNEMIVGYGNGLGQVELDGRAAGSRVHGKGALDCATGAIVAIGFGPEEGRIARLCPPPPKPRTHATVACVRHWR